MRTLARTATTALLCAAAAPCPAQDRLAPPHEAVTQPASDRPLTVASSPGAADADISRLLGLLSGSFSGAERPGSPSLTFSAAPVAVEGFPNTLLVQVARADAPAEPFRLYLLHAFRRRGKLTLRTLEPWGAPGLAGALAGLWAAPEAVRLSDAAALKPSSDMAVVRIGDLFRAKTLQPVPTTRDGAVEMRSSLAISGGTLRLADAGYDAEGKRVWGQPGGDESELQEIEFTRNAVTPGVRREPGGLTIVTTVPPKPDAPRHEPGGEITLHFTHWTSTGLRIQSSRDPGREPVKVRIPGAPLAALDRALEGIARGERRKIVIPPDLAYGERGRGTVPPNSTLIYDFECLAVDNTPAAPGVPEPPSADPHAHSHPRPDPRPDDPIGSPPTNGIPETPR